MEKMRMESMDMTAQNIEKIKALFPNCITETVDAEGKPKKAINFDILRQMLSSDVVERDETYEFTWVGKRAAIVDSTKPIRKTLRPCVEDSENWDTTENLYIEGDNLEVLKLIQESYLNSIKMIYIDPPYNTGNDFVYKDDYSASSEEYDEESGLFDANGNKLFRNTDSNGRFHSDWCSMIYSRLILARNLLRDDGAIFISIDDNEICNLKKICDEVFGAENYVAQITVIVKPEGRRYGSFAKSHDYLLVYAKCIGKLELNEIEVEGSGYKYEDEKGGFNLKGLRNRNVQAFNSTNRPNLRYPFFVDVNHPDKNGLFSVTPVETEDYLRVEASIVDGLESVWRWGKEKALNQKEDLTAYKGNDGEIRIFQKERKLTQTPKTVWSGKEIISNKGTKEVQELLGKGIFDFPKPLEFIKTIVSIGTNEGDLILDFFSGSATTAHAVFEKNLEDGGNRRFIMVQLPELTEEGSLADKAGFKTICDIGRERIRRAAQQLYKDNPGIEADFGFRTLRLDSTNMKDVFYAATEYNQDILALLESNIKEDRTPLDLLFSCLLEWGLPLSLPIESKTISGSTVYSYNEGDLIACFDENITEDVIKNIARLQPLRAVFRDDSFKDSPSKINVTEVFKLMAPNTHIKVI